MKITNKEIFDKLVKIKNVIMNGGTEGEKTAAKNRFENILRINGFTEGDFNETIIPIINYRDIESIFTFRAYNKSEFVILMLILRRHIYHH